MNKFIIASENTCDLDSELLSTLDIKIINLHYYINGVEYLPEEFEATDFYGKLRMGATGTTSQPNAYEFKTFWTKYLNEGYDILHLSFSSVLSGTYNNAVAVSQKLLPTYPERKILVLDTQSQSAGQGLLVTLVAKYKAEGHSLEECYEYAANIRQNINHIFTINDLRNLAKSGRVSNAEAFIGNILQIKPLLYTNAEGRLTPFLRLISRKLSLTTLVEKVKSKYNGMSDIIFITHSDCRKEAEFVASKLAEIGNVNITIFDLNPVIGCHTGADTISVFFTADNRTVAKY